MRVANRSLVLLAIGAFLAAPAVAQQTNAAPRQQATTAARRQITPADLKAWNTISSATLSNDGKWFAYVTAPREGDGSVVVRGTAEGAKETRFPVGNGGGQIVMSGDSRWLGFMIAPPRPPQAANRGGGPGREGGAGAAGATSAASAANARNKFALLNLATGEKKEFERIRRFVFNTTENPTWIALQGYPAGAAPPAPATTGGGRAGGPAAAPAAAAESDLLLYNIASGEQVNMGPVSEFAFNENGDLLAYTMDSPDMFGNAVQLRNLKTDAVKSIDSERALYRRLQWIDSSKALIVFRGRPDSVSRDTLYSLVTFTAFGPNGPAKKSVFDAKERKDMPSGMKVALDRTPTFSKDMSVVYFGLREAKRPAPGARGNSAIQAGAPGMGGNVNQTPRPASEDENPSLILWHAKDDRLQSQQIVQEQNDRNVTYMAAFRVGDDKVVRLTDDTLRSVSVTTGDRFAYATDSREYQREASWNGRNFIDLYSVDVKTGARKLLIKKHPAGGFRASPNGQLLLYNGGDGHYWTIDLASGEKKNITQGLPVSFINTESDVNNLVPPLYQALGWSKDNKYVLVSDGWDIWRVATAGGNAVNLTVDGKEKGIRYQRMYNFASTGRGGPGGAFGGGAQEGIDLSKPLHFATYGERTKNEGLSRVDPAKPGAVSLFFEPARFNIQKARDAEVYVYTRQTFTEFPDYWVANAGFKGARRLTDINPQLKEFAWSSGTRLIDYTTDKGAKLQGALYLPANYEPGKKYPLLVTIYEKRSQNMNSFVAPSETRAPDPALYTSRGYAVLDPDIVYEINDPGMSAVWAVIPAVKAAIATGVVDEKNVGLWGHSWGGYQTAFLVTQTDIFKAAIAGAALTDMVSMYSSIYWNTGGANQAIFESSQGRFKGNFIENYDAYIRNSPIFHADKVKTPLMLLHNDKDGAVDFNQGVIYYNTLRQLGKDVIMLEYVGENHGLSRPANQRDYAARMTEYFDHHLMGAPAADWIRNGVPRIRMDEHLQERKAPPKPIVP